MRRGIREQSKEFPEQFFSGKSQQCSGRSAIGKDVNYLQPIWRKNLRIKYQIYNTMWYLRILNMYSRKYQDYPRKEILTSL
jgi:hypothetical protein